MFLNGQTFQEDIAQESQKEIESEKQRVHEAKMELDTHRKRPKDVESKSLCVKERIYELSEEMEPLKVQ